MNNFFKIILLFILGISVVSCSKSDNDTEPLRDYAEQYVKDLANIETFMHTHYMTVSADQDVTFTLIPSGGTQTSIWDQTTYPIQTRQIKVWHSEDESVDYKIYYIKLAEGTGTKPCNVDKVLTAYKGEYIYDSVETVGENEIHTIISKEFETQDNPQSYFSLTGVVRGWGEIFPQFKAGTYVGNPDGTITYSGFGAGVMFLPSGLAYFGGATGGIPTYSPLIFNIKLYEVQRADQDGDGIESYLEDVDEDGYMYALPTGVTNIDNTNPPGSKVLLSSNPDRYSAENELPDFLDSDDDGDFFTTASEIKNPITGEAYPFADIPTCGGTGTTKKHLDPTCH